MIVRLPLLAASYITQQLPNSRCQEYQIVGDYRNSFHYTILVFTCLKEQNVKVARIRECVIKHWAAAGWERHFCTVDHNVMVV